MISNLRYFIDKGKLIVKWNYENVSPQVKVTCVLRKRIDPSKEIKRESDYTMEAYHNAGGGVIFDLPKVPVSIELFDQEHPSEKVCCDVNGPNRYNIKADMKIWDESYEEVVRPGFLGIGRVVRTVTTRKMRAWISFPDTLEDTELETIEPWVVCCVYRRGDVEDRFFWPGPFQQGENRLPDVVIHGNVDEQNFTFEIVPEAEKSRYKGMFTVNGQAADADDDQPGCVKQIHLDSLKPTTENGLYPVVCPFCLEEFPAEQALFRSQVYSQGAGYDEEEDKVYGKPLERFGQNVSGQKMGAVLIWHGTGHPIKQFALAEDPTKFADFTSEDQIRGKVVVAVKDEFGHTSHQKICPYCHYPIPTFSGKFPSLFVNMMGNTGCGKTIYLARTISMLKEGKLLPGYQFELRMNANAESQRYENAFDVIAGRIEPRHDAELAMQTHDNGLRQERAERRERTVESLQPQPRRGAVSEGRSGQRGGVSGLSRGGRETSDRIREEMPAQSAEETRRAPVEERTETANRRIRISDDPFAIRQQPRRNDDPHRMLDSTSVKYLEPCVCELRSNDNKQGLILALFDFPGELVTRIGAQRGQYDVYYERLLEETDGMIFLFDPMTLDRIRNMGRDKQRKFSEQTYVAAELGKIEQLLAKNPSTILSCFQKKFCPNAAMNFPIVCAVSKSDAIRDYLPQLDLNMATMDMRFLDESNFATSEGRTGIDIQEIEENSRKVLAFAGDMQLERTSSRIADNYVWMCVSAIGIAPKNGTLAGRYGNPVWMMAPIEWILYQNQKKNKGAE